MADIIEQTASMAGWHKLVSEAETASGVQLDEELESYLVFTLMRYLSRPDMAHRVLALDYLQAAQHSGSLQQQQLREVGDHCLLFSGLFPQRAERRRVRVSYYVELGRSAYHHLGECVDVLAELYQRMSHSFVKAMDILQAIRSMDSAQQLDPLNAAELWQDTGSHHAWQVLQQTTSSIPFPADDDPNPDKVH